MTMPQLIRTAKLEGVAEYTGLKKQDLIFKILKERVKQNGLMYGEGTLEVLPDGFGRGEPFRLYDGQLLYLASFYTVRGDVEFDARNPILGPAFRYSRGLMVGPQKQGKSPASAAHICLEGVGPSLFAGWAGKDDGYACIEHGCGCGWEYEYLKGEAMGAPRRKSMLGLLAFAESQTANVYEPLQTMIASGPLQEFVKVREGYIGLPNRGKIVPLTSKSNRQERW